MHQPKRRELSAFIDENLRRVYDETMERGVPDNSRTLLNQLKSRINQLVKRMSAR